jgi:hypothetical protein
MRRLPRRVTDGDHGIDRQPGAILRASARVRHTSESVRGRSPVRTQLIKAALRNSPADNKKITSVTAVNVRERR